MTRNKSMFKTLARGLAVVGFTGTAFLLAAVVIEYRFTFSELSTSEAIKAALKEMIEHVALPVGALLVPMAIASLWVMRRAFRPLSEAAAALEELTAQDRDIRIDDHALPIEVLPFTQAVNNLLSKLADAATRHESFAADIAHELRTPLASMMLELDEIDHPAAMRLKSDVASMRRLIDQLMLLAQMDAQQASATATDTIDLNDVAREVVARTAPAIIADGKSIELSATEQPAIVRGRKEAIAAALRNLIENAVRVTPLGGRILVSVGAGPHLRVADEGQGLSTEQLASLVQRNRRSDHSSPDGAGLGLAIVDRIMHLHGGRVRTEPQQKALVLDFS